jgi:hypothetical protein
VPCRRGARLARVCRGEGVPAVDWRTGPRSGALRVLSAPPEYSPCVAAGYGARWPSWGRPRRAAPGAGHGRCSWAVLMLIEWEREWERVALRGTAACFVVLGPAAAGLRGRA